MYNETDPYGSVEEKPRSLGSAVASLANPVSLTWSYYTMYPGSWNLRKGMKIPFGFRKGPVDRDFLNRRAWVNLKKGHPIKAFKNLSESYGGSGFIGGRRMSSAAKLTTEKDRFYRMLRKQGHGRRTSWALTDIFSRTGSEEDLASSVFGVTKIRTKIGTEEFHLRTLTKMYKENIGKINNLNKLRKLGRFGNAIKWGTRIGKGASIIGMASLMWDITQTIGVPIGKAMIGSVENTLTRYNERFMPEMGGQLALSYMSQGAYTERQRALQAMSDASINGRSMMGSEASYYHNM